MERAFICHTPLIFIHLLLFFLSLVPLMAAENKKKNYRRRKVEDDADASDHDEAVDDK